MTKTMQQAIDALQELPKDRQEMLARAIIDYAAHVDEVYHLSEEERQLIDEGLASPLVRDEEMEKFWRRHAA